jgi:hypothetical protein
VQYSADAQSLDAPAKPHGFVDVSINNKPKLSMLNATHALKIARDRRFRRPTGFERAFKKVSQMSTLLDFCASASSAPSITQRHLHLPRGLRRS